MEDTLIMDAVINKYFAGETSDREEQFLMAWLEESEEHRKYFFELKSIWNARNVFAESADLGRFAAFMRSTDARIAKIAGEERARRRRGLLRWSMSAAAAVLLVVCAGFAWHFLGVMPCFSRRCSPPRSNRLIMNAGQNQPDPVLQMLVEIVQPRRNHLPFPQGARDLPAADDAGRY